MAAFSGSATCTFNLGDQKKRWLVVGICLNHVVVPVLRETVKTEITKHYNNLKATHSVDTQVHGTHLKQDASFKFNYESINNNWANHKRKERLYDYTVKSPEQLGKLYLQQHMAQFTAFDNTCDASAVLGILCNVSVFSSVSRKNATDVRASVRNEWGHCNFDTWSGSTFAKCFQLMETLIRGVGLTAVEEKRVVDELSDWQRKGIQLCIGHPVDEDLIKLVSEEVTTLSREVDQMRNLNEEEAKLVRGSLDTVNEAIQEFHAQLEKLKEKVEAIDSRVTGVEDKLGSTDAKVTALAKDHQKLEERMDNLDVSGKNGSQKVFIFNAPDRKQYFCGRGEQLDSLKQHMDAIENDVCKISAVCGLGGTGKTSLVVEHIWLEKEAYKGGVFWVSGDSKRAFQLSVCDMARRLGLDTEEKGEFSETLSRTLNWLQRTEELFCLVVNNLDEMELSEDMTKIFRGQWRRGTRGHIVITSRREPREISEEVGVEEEQCIELKNLTEQEGLQFFKMRTRTESLRDNSIIRELVRELGGLPLALEQAAAYIRFVGSDFSSYLAKYKKEKLSLLKKRKVPRLVEDTSQDRLAVHTTWTLNFDYVSRMSEEFGLGQAAALVMEMSAYLAPDDIPFSVINQGLPQVENEELCKCAIDSSGAAELVSVLTKFSLFQRNSARSYSVHRLVQEVIRDRMAHDKVLEVLGSAVRMLNFSFCHTTSPHQVCTDLHDATVLARETYPSLQRWGRLALHACALQEHLVRFAERNRMVYESLLYTEQAARLLNEASIYLDVSRETAKAFELQRKKLELLMEVKKMPPDDRMEVLKARTIPLTDRDFRLICECMKQVEPSETNRMNEGDPQQLLLALEEAEALRLQGNKAVKENNHQKALDLYTEAITVRENDHRLFSNRALCYLKLDRPGEALEDCDRCLQLSPGFTKAVMRKAWALYELAAKSGQQHLKNRAQAAADLAVHIDANLSRELSMFPRCSPYLVNGSLHLNQALLVSPAGTTLLLKEGTYDLSSICIRKDLQIVGLGVGITLTCTRFCIAGCNCYFENVTFPKGSSTIDCTFGAVVSFHECVISGGSSSCEDFPECNGGPGCVAVERPCDRMGKYGEPELSGVGGYPGVQFVIGSRGYIDKCKLSNCGGGGMLVCGEGSVADVHKCEVFKNHQAGLEARVAGKLRATSNKLYGNGFHGILVGPNAGFCEIKGNKVFENSREGMLVCSTDDEVTVEGNDIYHNAAYGISIDYSTLAISNNRIFENCFWGIFAKSKTNARITENTIFSNKCGGVFVGVNYSGRIVLDKNVIRDHTEEGIHFEKCPEMSLPGHYSPEEMLDFGIPPGETKFFSNPPVIGRNVLSNNEETSRHPRERLQNNPRECGYCHRPANDVNCCYCSKCNITAYCNQECQQMSSKKHKAFCAMVASHYSVSVEVRPYFSFFCDGIDKIKARRTFSPKLKGIGKGPKLDPNSHRRFIVKIQTQSLNGHPLQMLSIYDRSLSIDGWIQSPEAFSVVVECGVLGSLNKLTSKKAYFWAVFTEGGKKLTIFLGDLAPFQEW